jgi:hypothetical protein
MSGANKQLLSAAGGGDPLYVEDVFSQFLYDGNGSTQSVNNGLDISGEDGLVWIKNRDQATSHVLIDSIRGAGEFLASHAASAETTDADTITAFSDSGFDLGADAKVNQNNEKYASWAFRKQTKFFDIVTYTGSGGVDPVPHNLGCVPGCIIVKRLDSSENWAVYHRSASGDLSLNSNAAAGGFLGFQSVDASEFLCYNNSKTDASGGSYVAYLFAHNESDFGSYSDESIIYCGSFSTDGSGYAAVSLGWEPQFLLAKTDDVSGHWSIRDVNRGFDLDGALIPIYASLSAAESNSAGSYGHVTADGFEVNTLGANADYIFIAIRRPMKPPESASEVYYAQSGGVGNPGELNSPFNPDFVLYKYSITSASGHWASYRLLGSNYRLDPTGPGQRSSYSTSLEWNDRQNGVYGTFFQSAYDPLLGIALRRAPEFFDVVAYDGTGSARTIPHNLAAVPELMICKCWTGGTGYWSIYHAGNTAEPETEYLEFDSGATSDHVSHWNDTPPTSTVFTVGTHTSVNDASRRYLALLFASVPGVSKVGSYTGTGADLTIDCGFTSGAALVLIKRVDSTGDWYLWTAARGIAAGNDSYFLMNTTAAEVSTNDYIDPDSSGFIVTSSAPAALNTLGGEYVFLSIAA